MNTSMTFALALALSVSFVPAVLAAPHRQDASLPPLSQESRACIACHEIYTPGIVRDWRSSLHAQTVPTTALKKPEAERRISVTAVPERFAGVAVGCYECHSQNAERHRDNFKHNGFRINVVVSPNDCKTCHEKEAVQYGGSKKAHAVKNLAGNPVYHALVNTVNGVKQVTDGKISARPGSDTTMNETCFGCHGTKVEVKGMKTIKTATGEMSVPDLTNWPNQGVGRENPDGSTGSCSSCHARHSFSIKMARKPYTCAQCHLEPDVPAYNVYKESKHGNIYESMEDDFDFTAVPWKVGEHFRAPTCATCQTVRSRHRTAECWRNAPTTSASAFGSASSASRTRTRSRSPAIPPLFAMPTACRCRPPSPVSRPHPT